MSMCFNYNGWPNVKGVRSLKYSSEALLPRSSVQYPSSPNLFHCFMSTLRVLVGPAPYLQSTFRWVFEHLLRRVFSTRTPHMHFTNIPPGSRRKLYERIELFAVGAVAHSARWVGNRRKATHICLTQETSENLEVLRGTPAETRCTECYDWWVQSVSQTEPCLGPGACLPIQ